MSGHDVTRSMTGFAEGRMERNGWSVVISLRCVNHRFLDLHIYLPEGWENQEPLVRRLVREQIRRGRVEVRLSAGTSAESAVELNRELAGKYMEMLENLRRDFKISTEPDMAQFLRLPGVVGPPRAMAPQCDGEQCVEQLLGEILAELNQMRVAEGSALSEDLRAHLQRITELTENAVGLAAQTRGLFAQRLENRLRELLGTQSIDPMRLMQEAALASERADVTEEFTRLRSHGAQFAAILEEGGRTGKRLDFLVQEMHREANTLLSKISGAETENLAMTRIGLEIKSEIESLREQVQNLE